MPVSPNGMNFYGNIDEIVSEIDRQLQNIKERRTPAVYIEQENLFVYRISIRFRITLSTEEGIKRIYKNAGWQTVSVVSGTRSGTSVVTLCA